MSESGGQARRNQDRMHGHWTGKVKNGLLVARTSISRLCSQVKKHEGFSFDLWLNDYFLTLFS